MRLRKHDRPWAPLDHPDYLCVLKPGYQSPRDREAFLLDQAELVRRLVAQANGGAIQDANRRLESGLFVDPKTPNYLMFNPAVEGGNLHEWKVGADELLALPSMPDREAWQLAQELCLD